MVCSHFPRVLDGHWQRLSTVSASGFHLNVYRGRSLEYGIVEVMSHRLSSLISWGNFSPDREKRKGSIAFPLYSSLFLSKPHKERGPRRKVIMLNKPTHQKWKYISHIHSIMAIQFNASYISRLMNFECLKKKCEPCIFVKAKMRKNFSSKA